MDGPAAAGPNNASYNRHWLSLGILQLLTFELFTFCRELGAVPLPNNHVPKKEAACIVQAVSCSLNICPTIRLRPPIHLDYRGCKSPSLTRGLGRIQNLNPRMGRRHLIHYANPPEFSPNHKNKEKLQNMVRSSEDWMDGCAEKRE